MISNKTNVQRNMLETFTLVGSFSVFEYDLQHFLWKM